MGIGAWKFRCAGVKKERGVLESIEMWDFEEYGDENVEMSVSGEKGSANV